MPDTVHQAFFLNVPLLQSLTERITETGNFFLVELKKIK